jgi:hypothetical protein
VVLGCFGTLILKAVPPPALLVPISGIILIGVILGWATGLNKSADVVGASKLVKWWGPVWTAGEMFNNLGIIIPIGISAAATMSTQCNQSMEHIWSTLLHNRWNVFIGCGWNTTHTTKYCNEFKRNGASFAVSPLHPYWALLKKAHPSASPSGSTIPSAGSSAGSQSTMSDHMISLINKQMTQTKNSDMASLLAELKNCLQGN